jgi:hypothetical protein
MCFAPSDAIIRQNLGFLGFSKKMSQNGTCQFMESEKNEKKHIFFKKKIATAKETTSDLAN